MNKHVRYGWYIARHKVFVLLAGLRTEAPLWRLVAHDWSKLLPDEWGPYCAYFYGEEAERDKAAFDRAWLKHQHRNPHHWQHHLLQYDDGDAVALEMPEHFAREMVADWMGAGRAITGRWEVQEWYRQNKGHITLHPATEALVRFLLRQ